jgi:hypothetical protein
MEWNEQTKQTLREAARQLMGPARRKFMAGIAKSFGWGGISKVQRELGWNRRTVAKGMKELETGVDIIDNFAARGRKKAEEHLFNLLDDIRDIVDSQSQTDPRFQSNRLYRRITAPEVRRQLIERKGYDPETVPAVRTLCEKLTTLGYKPAKVQKCKPQKRFPRRTPSSKS